MADGGGNKSTGDQIGGQSKHSDREIDGREEGLPDGEIPDELKDGPKDHRPVGKSPA